MLNCDRMLIGRPSSVETSSPGGEVVGKTSGKSINAPFNIAVSSLKGAINTRPVSPLARFQ